VILDADPEIGRYYRHLSHVFRRSDNKIQRPAWKEHISVVRNEEPPADKKPLWGKHEGEVVVFSYNPIACSRGGESLSGQDLYVWFEVDCSRLLDLREELGLSRRPEFDLHLTIGNRKFG
jgi:hypothetical protein